MYKFSKYREQYRLNLKLALPVMLSQLGQVVVQLADNTMVGQYGGNDPVPLAAASFGGGLFFLLFVTIMGLTFGITPIVGELFAQKRVAESTKYLQNGFLLYGVSAVIVTILQFAIIPFMWRMGQPDEVVEMAIPYYRTLVWSLPSVIIFFSIKQFLEGVGNTTVAMWSVVIANALNIVLNYALIGGELGAPEMGTLGAGVATLISRVVSMVIILIYFFRSQLFAEYRRHFSRNNFSMRAIKRLFAMGSPISAQIFFEAGAFIITGFLFGWFGTTAIGANQIGTTMGNCSFMIIVAVGAATTIRVSHCFGERNFSQMRRASNAAFHLSLVWNLSMALIFFLLRDTLPRLFTTNEEVIELASILLLTIAAYQIPDGLQCIGIGVLRGMQDVKIIPVISFVSYWICNIPIGYLCAFTFGMGVTGLYMGFMSGFAVAMVLIFLRIRHRQRQLLLNK